MKKYSNRVKELRLAKSLSQEQLAEKIGLTKQAISQYERGDRNPSMAVLGALCDFFNVSSDYLLGKDVVTLRFVGKNEIDKLESKSSIRIPVLGRVAAGVPIDAIEDVLEDWEEIPEAMAATGDFFGLRVKGDSMQPRIAEGDVVIVRSQPDAESGDVVIVQVNGDHATCKRLMKHETGISLISFNPMYAPINFTNEEIESLPVTIIGKVVENRQKY